jgi:hypothetical protein
MDQGLFKKHILTIQALHDTQEEVRLYIQKETGIPLINDELRISKKVVTLQTSSVKRSLLLQKGIKTLLQKKGYSLT